MITYQQIHSWKVIYRKRFIFPFIYINFFNLWGFTKIIKAKTFNNALNNAWKYPNISQCVKDKYQITVIFIK
jgi:hypothetical protein